MVQTKFSRGGTAVDEHGTNWNVKDIYRSLDDGTIYYHLETPCGHCSKVKSKELVESNYSTIDEVVEMRENEE